MLKKTIWTLILLAAVCIVCSGCEIVDQKREVESESGYYCYSLNKDATMLEQEPYLPEEDDINYMIKDLMQKLGSKNAEEKVINLLPQEVTINSYELQGQILVIDFNGQYSKMSRTREVVVRAGIVKTFMQLPGIHSVRFTVAGEPLLDIKGAEIGEMTDQSFIEYSISSNLDMYCYDTFTLYFADATGTKLVEEKRSIYYRRSLSKERVVLEQLAKGPREMGNYPTISENTTILNISIADDICYINLNRNFVDSALNLPSEISIYSIVNSLVESCGIEKVEIAIDGNVDFVFGEDMTLFQYYEKNNDLIIISEDKEDH